MSEGIEIAGTKYDPETKILKLSKKNLKSIPDLSGFKNLEELDLSNNKIGKVENVEGLVHLQKLNLLNNSITKMEGLENLRDLKMLWLTDNDIEVIEGIDQLPSLQVLHLGNNKIKKLEGLPASLEILEIDRNYISTMADLKGYIAVKEIYMQENELPVFSYDHMPESIMVLYMHHNKIKETYPPAKPLQHLIDLYLVDNPFSKLENLEHFPRLECVAFTIKNITAITSETYKVLQKDGMINEGEFDFPKSMTASPQKLETMVAKGMIKIVE